MNASKATTKAKAKAPAKKGSGKTSQKNPDVKKLYELGTAFWASGTLIAAIKLNLFTQLAKGPLTIEAIARRLGTNKRWTDKLVTACAAMGLLEKTDSQFANSAAAAHFLVEGSPYYQGAFFTHMSSLWSRFGSLEETVKTGNRSSEESASKNGNSDTNTSRAWIMSAHNIAMSGQAESLALALDLKGRKKLCDVGGGPGTYAAALCLRNPDLEAVVLDDPEVVPVARELITRAGLEKRVEVKPFQLLSDSYGNGYDVVLLSGVLHGLTEANCKKVLRKIFNALANDGIIVIQEMLLDDEEAKPLFPALFSLNMTLGASYTAADIMGWLYHVGFVKAEVEEIDAPWMDHIILAKKVK